MEPPGDVDLRSEKSVAEQDYYSESDGLGLKAGGDAVAEPYVPLPPPQVNY